MGKSFGRDVIRRWKGNPLLTLDDLPFHANDIHNEGVVRTNGEYLLLVTVEGLEGRQRIFLAHSTDGHHFWIDKTPFMKASKAQDYVCYEAYGVRDARVTPMDDRYLIVYVTEGEYGPRVGIAETADFAGVNRIGFTSEPDTKNGALFPKKINGRYALLERPFEGSSIWLKYSDDLTWWTGGTCVMTEKSTALLIGPISPAAPGPLYQQIVDGFTRAISEGRLAPGTALPSFRALAEELMVSLITVKRAYEELEREGIIFRRQGLGTFVSEQGHEASRDAKLKNARKLFEQAARDAAEAGLGPAEIRQLAREAIDEETRSS